MGWGEELGEAEVMSVTPNLVGQDGGSPSQRRYLNRDG
jgi:hypothetical protein